MKSFTFIRQPDSMDCGPTCLQMIIEYYGKKVSLQTLRDKTQKGKAGVNLLGISEAAENLGFRTQAVRLDYNSLINNAHLPCILHWNQNHFVVLYQIKKSYPNYFRKKKTYETLSIADPAHGLITFFKEEFLQLWLNGKNTSGIDEGIALLLEITPRFQGQEDDPYFPGNGRKDVLAFKNIFNYLRPYKKLIFKLFLCLGIASILQFILPFLTQSIVDVGVNGANIHFVNIVLLAQIALFIGRIITDFVRNWILLHLSTRISISILTDFLIKLMKLPLSFFDSKKTGDVFQRMNDHQRIESFLTGSSVNILFSFINLVIFSLVLAVLHVTIFSVFFIASILYSIWVIIFLKRRKALDYKRFNTASKEQSITIQLIQGMQEIKLNGVERTMRWNWERLQAKLFKLNMKNLVLNQWQQSGASFINEGKNIFITFLSAKAVIDGQMTLGSMLAVQYIIGQLNSPIEHMIGYIQSWQNAKISMERLNEIHKLEDEEPMNKGLLQELPITFARQVLGGKMFPVSQHNLPNFLDNDLNVANFSVGNNYVKTSEGLGIYFNNVTFTYSGAGNEAILRNINLKIPIGKTTAIVGASGSGKTTIIKLLLKFYEPQKGEIDLANVLLSSISHKIWRSHCGVVMQESFIFSDSIAKNIAVSAEKVDMEKLRYAAMIANITEFIDSLPLGFNTKIGPDGMGISMGQRQRILIARAVYRDPEFIFFDEATNSLDSNNERIIVDNLASFFKGKTVVVVAHRLSTVKYADQIVVLNKGIITERGTHQELVKLKGEYFTLVKNQLELGE